VPRYMSQDLFNSLAVKLAWMSRIDSADNRTSAAAIDGALQKYRRFFTADPFEHELRHVRPIPIRRNRWPGSMRYATRSRDTNHPVRPSPLAC
jgi:hypothetical protein